MKKLFLMLGLSALIMLTVELLESATNSNLQKIWLVSWLGLVISLLGVVLIVLARVILWLRGVYKRFPKPAEPPAKQWSYRP